MGRPFALAAGVVFCSAVSVCAAEGQPPRAIGNLRLPATVIEVADAIGLHRIDPSTLPIDIVRLAFASPDGSNAAETHARAALLAVLTRRGSGDVVPLPLSGDTWRTRVLHADIADERLAAAIFSRRPHALLYHALFGMDAETLAWLEAHGDALEPLVRNPAVAAVYARSIRIRDGAVQTPAEASRDLWTILVGADPSDPAVFIARLLSAHGGRVAAFYDAVAHADAAHQAFLLGRPGDPARVERARGVLDVVTRNGAPWTIADHPFLRADVDLPLVLRAIDVEPNGAPRPPRARTLWAAVWGEPDDGDADVDAEWLLRALLAPAGAAARRRLDTLAFAQRSLHDATPSTELEFVLRQHPRVVALLAMLVENGVTDPALCASAVRVAASVEKNEDVMIVFQSELAIVDAARRAGSLSSDAAREAIVSLVKVAAAKRPRAALLQWTSTALPAALSAAAGEPLERAALSAIAGRLRSAPVVTWEGQEYAVDLPRAELRRLTRTRAAQDEGTLDTAVAASSERSLRPLATTLAAMVYAVAMGEPDGRSIDGGSVWRRHRFGGDGLGQEPNGTAWRVATEVFGPRGWHLTGSLLYLRAALPHLALRRLDESEMPLSSQLSTNDRRSVALSVALADPRQMTDAQRDAIAAAMTVGRQRIAALAAHPEMLDDMAMQWGVGDWRRTSVAWLIDRDPAHVPQAFTTLDVYRAGGGPPVDAWGGASSAVDGCLCLRFPRGGWEDATGRPSSGQLGAQFADALLRTADVLAARRLPAALARDVAAFATSDALDRASPGWSGDWLTVAFAARDLPDDRFADYIASLAAMGPLLPVAKGSR